MFKDTTLSKIINIYSKINSLSKKNINLPSFVMLGSQSSGKSILLSRLINFSLPSGTGMVTKRPTVIYLIKSEKIKVSVSNINLLEQEKENLEETEKIFFNFISSYEFIKEQMSILTEIELIIRFYSPNLFPIKLIDLPGLIRFNNKNQEACEIIEKINLKYLLDPSSLILNVMGGNVDFHTIESLSLNRKVDPEFVRSFFVVTKLDLIPQVSINNSFEKTNEVVNLLRFLGNEELKTKNGACGIINFQNSDTDFEKMRLDEREFLRKSSFSEIEGIGIDFLIKKMRDIYETHLRLTFPSFEKSLKILLKENKTEYKKTLKAQNYQTKSKNLLLIEFNRDIKNILNILLSKEKETKTFHLPFDQNLKEEIKRLFSIKKIKKLINKNCNIFNFKETFENSVLENLKEEETHLIQKFILLKDILEKIVKGITCDSINLFLLQDLKVFILNILKQRYKKIKSFIKRVIKVEQGFINCDLPEFNSDFLNKIRNQVFSKDLDFTNTRNIQNQSLIKSDIGTEIIKKDLNSMLCNLYVNSVEIPSQIKEKTYENSALEVYYNFYCSRMSNNLMDIFKKVLYSELFIYFDKKLPLKLINFLKKHVSKKEFVNNKKLNKIKLKESLKNINNLTRLLEKLHETKTLPVH
ncbi:Vacuolar protein sorting-associated protein 1 [Cucumispora dikerogammari]|nr:Vacuolar protein sorting-associated protein 1 [Cucumispora dikerogammari]